MVGWSTLSDNSALDARDARLAGGTFKIREGTTDIFSITLGNPAFGTAANGELVINATANATAAANTVSGVDNFQLVTSGAVVDFSWENISFTVTAANQSTANDTFTRTAHGLSSGDLVIVSGTIPTTSPQISTGDLLIVERVDANAFKLKRNYYNTAVDITAAAGDDTFQVTLHPKAIATSSAGDAMLLINKADLTFTAGQVFAISSFKIKANLFS